MKRIVTLALIICWLAVPASASAEFSVVIIKSSDNRFFNASIESLQNNLPKDIRTSVKMLDVGTPASTRVDGADLIITLGYDAMQWSARQTDGIATLHAYLTEFQYRQHPSPKGHASILLDQPLERYIRFARLLLAPNTVGILSSPENPVGTRELQAIETQHQIKLHESIHQPDDNLIDSLRQLLKRSELLLALPAPEIYNQKNLKGILLTAYRMNRPMISYSPSHVTSGALGAIFTSPENIGKQLADLSTTMLRNPRFEPHPFYYASAFDIAINDNVAQSLNLNIPRREALMQSLQQESSR
jgi:putative ABC transport system substrate-binding protein